MTKSFVIIIPILLALFGGVLARDLYFISRSTSILKTANADQLLITQKMKSDTKLIASGSASDPRALFCDSQKKLAAIVAEQEKARSYIVSQIILRQPEDKIQSFSDSIEAMKDSIKSHKRLCS